MRFEVLEPTERPCTVYEGSVVELRHPTAMTDPSSAFRENPHKQVTLDLVHEAVGPLSGHKSEGPVADPEKEFARAHYEQHVRAAVRRRTEELCARIRVGDGDSGPWGRRRRRPRPHYRPRQAQRDQPGLSGIVATPAAGEPSAGCQAAAIEVAADRVAGSAGVSARRRGIMMAGPPP